MAYFTKPIRPNLYIIICSGYSFAFCIVNQNQLLFFKQVGYREMLRKKLTKFLPFFLLGTACFLLHLADAEFSAEILLLAVPPLQWRTVFTEFKLAIIFHNRLFKNFVQIYALKVWFEQRINKIFTRNKMYEAVTWFVRRRKIFIRVHFFLNWPCTKSFKMNYYCHFLDGVDQNF